MHAFEHTYAHIIYTYTHDTYIYIHISPFLSTYWRPLFHTDATNSKTRLILMFFLSIFELTSVAMRKQDPLILNILLIWSTSPYAITIATFLLHKYPSYLVRPLVPDSSLCEILFYILGCDTLCLPVVGEECPPYRAWTQNTTFQGTPFLSYPWNLCKYLPSSPTLSGFKIELFWKEKEEKKKMRKKKNKRMTSGIG